MDPLSQLLSVLKPESCISGGIVLNAEMSVEWPAHEGVKCYAVITGECWLTVDGVKQPLRLVAGDCYLLPPGPPFRLTTDLSAKSVDFQTIRSEIVSVTAEKLVEKPACLMVGGHFILAGRPAQLLLGGLPPVVHIQKKSDKAAMSWALERMLQEVREPQPGSGLIVQQLAFMLLIEALRLHANDNHKENIGWLFALRDKKLGAALACMHQNPENKWTLNMLAVQAGMSRAAFAKHFKQTVGISPIEYLTQWRMVLACGRLQNSKDSISRISTELGYESESAFRKAFKRVIGSAPGMITDKKKH
ncbi:AraC family transcriptional regulator [Dickeya zeae]|nr:AraC family transcriptional regulator [Dickeya zeae]